MAALTYSGSCLCGETKIKVASAQDAQIACHCTDCQHTSGTAFSSNILPKKTDVEITGAAKEYNATAASGNTVTRVFCGSCGSPIAHKSVAFGDAMAVQTGNLIPAFAKVPYAAELFTKSRWSGMAPLEGAAQKETM